ncbi:MAG: ATP synthase F1 subunit delta [Alphaproteobacteria bacterium]|nr:ATP synthase F1 subunit delta [Alphaproteobacteria bacterium]
MVVDFIDRMCYIPVEEYGEETLSDVGFVIENAVINRYVKSLHGVSLQNNKENEYLKQIVSVDDFIKKIPNNEKVLKRLTLLAYREVSFIENMIGELKLSKEVGNFLKLLLKNKRFGLISDVCKSYISFVESRHGKKTFYITYAKHFSNEDENKLKQELGTIFQCDVECIARKDSSLIDGIQIRYRSKVLDYSLKSKLVRLESAIKGDNYEH